MQERKQPITINLTPGTLDLLTDEGWKRRMSRSVLVEEALKAYLLPQVYAVAAPTPPPLPEGPPNELYPGGAYPMQNPSDPDLEEVTLSDQDTK
jgi:hypothetical protein